MRSVWFVFLFACALEYIKHVRCFPVTCIHRLRECTCNVHVVRFCGLLVQHNATATDSGGRRGFGASVSVAAKASAPQAMLCTRNHVLEWLCVCGHVFANIHLPCACREYSRFRSLVQSKSVGAHMAEDIGDATQRVHLVRETGSCIYQM